jgi:AcrR family transcriptional regulator
MLEAGDVDSVSMRAIAHEVGVSAPAIYIHFSDKDELFDAICDRSFRELNRIFQEAISQSDDPLERLRLCGKAYVRFGVENPEAYRFLMMNNSEHNHPDALMSHDPSQGELAFQTLLGLVHRCIEAGAIRPMDTLEAGLILWANVHGLTSLLITNPKFEWATGLEDKLIETCIYGLAPRPVS